MRVLAKVLVWGVAGVVAIGVLLLVGTPAPVATHRFESAPPRALDGPLAPNTALAACEIFGVDEIWGPEELEIDARGRVYTGTRDGKIVRLSFGAGEPRIEVYAEPGGGPNGLSFDANGILLASDGWDVPSSWIAPDGSVARFPIEHGQDSAIASDGTIYLPRYTDSNPTENLMVNVLRRIGEASPTGELLAYDPRDGSVETLTSGLIWPDGVALSAGEDFVAVGEVSAYRISRYWLRGPKAGTRDILVENLPGFVDGLAQDGQGHFYASITMIRSGLLSWFHRHPWAKDQMLKIVTPAVASFLTSNAPGGRKGYAFVLVIDEDGQLIRSYQDPQSAIGPAVNTAEPHGEHLYIGSLGGRGIGRCPLDAV